MQDPVTVKYEVLETLFCQKIRAKVEKQEVEKKKEPTEVSCYLLVVFCSFFIT